MSGRSRRKSAKRASNSSMVSGASVALLDQGPERLDTPSGAVVAQLGDCLDVEQTLALSLLPRASKRVQVPRTRKVEQNPRDGRHWYAVDLRPQRRIERTNAMENDPRPA